jgi:hypothetical protein
MRLGDLAFFFTASVTFSAISAQHVVTTPLTWQDAAAACNTTYHTRLYPPPTQPSDLWIFAFVRNLTQPLYWIQRRGATTCTAVPNDATDEGSLEEYSCDGDSFPAICT